MSRPARVYLLDDDFDESSHRYVYLAEQLGLAGYELCGRTLPSALLADLEQDRQNAFDIALVLIDVMLPTDNVVSRVQAEGNFNTGFAIVDVVRGRFPGLRIAMTSRRDDDPLHEQLDAQGLEFVDSLLGIAAYSRRVVEVARCVSRQEDRV